MFSINCLEITASKSQWEQNKSLYKNLLSDKDFNGQANDSSISKRYLFNDYYIIKADGSLEKNPQRNLPENFFGDRINVQAVVGENGAGKSSLMDLMYMAINNFCYMFERGNHRLGADSLYYVKDLYVCLHFTIGENDIPHKLICNGPNVSICANGNEIDSFEISEQESSDPKHKGRNDNQIKKLVEDFFYSIISNYSLQSFIENNYTRPCYNYDYTGEDNSKLCDYFYGENTPWINSIFHKNGGYIRSIVINPYRGEGNIDLNKEVILSKDRLIALSLWSKHYDIPMFKPYSFKKMIIRETEYNVGDISEDLRVSITSYDGDPASIAHPYVEQYLYEMAKYVFIQKRDLDSSTIQDVIEQLTLPIVTYFVSDDPRAPFSEKIINVFKLNPRDPLIRKTVTYLQNKILKIVYKYDAYKEFRPFVINYIISEKKDDATIVKIDEVLNKIVNDKSHVTKKIRRTVNFFTLKYYENAKKNDDDSIIISEKDFFDSFVNLDKTPFNYDCSQDNLSPEIIDDCMPPTFFQCDLKLYKNNNQNDEIDYSNLSSGEIQLFQTLSTHLYHVSNLLSVNDNRPKYKNFNLVFDELEICMHPEYQRRFIDMLLFALNNVVHGRECWINVFIFTHSPFILSDIPTNNILFLIEGSQDDSKNKKTITFAQNIGEMMYDSFFMKKTIGDFAEAKLKRIIKIKQGRNPDSRDEQYTNDEEGKNLQKAHKKEMEMNLALIGDPVIRSLIEEIDKKGA